MGRYVNESNLPQPIFDAVAGDQYSRGGKEVDISVTSLIDSPRLEALKEAHKDEIVEDVADMANSLIGVAVHAYLSGDNAILLEVAAAAESGEKERLDDALEKWRLHKETLNDKLRLSMLVDGWVVSGQTDYYKDGIIYDWKVPSVREAKFGLKQERIHQLNVYRVLLETNGYPVTGLSAILITKNWSPYDVNLVEHNIVPRPVDMWEFDDALVYIRERVAAHQQARVTLPECSSEERWQEADTFAVVKVGSVRAVRGGVKNTEEEAEALAQELSETTPHIVEYRAGDPTTADRRCFSWKCSVYSFCEQGQAIHNGIGGN